MKAIFILLSLFVITPTIAFGSHDSGYNACRNDGLWDSQDGVPYSPELFDMCGAPYLDAYIEGCMSLNNTKEVCVSLTDPK